MDAIVKVNGQFMHCFQVKRLLIYLLLILLISCNKDDVFEEQEEVEEEVINYVYRDYIVAGQDTGIGIRYVDVNPDIILYISDSKRLTTESIDFDNDSIPDFEIQIERSPEWQLGSAYKSVSVIPLNSNFVCVMKYEQGLAKPFNANDTIRENENWSVGSALLYAYIYFDGRGERYDGHWHWSQSSDFFVGAKLSEGEHSLYGWIDINFINVNKVSLRQFAVTAPYPMGEK